VKLGPPLTSYNLNKFSSYFERPHYAIQNAEEEEEEKRNPLITFYTLRRQILVGTALSALRYGIVPDKENGVSRVVFDRRSSVKELKKDKLESP
jgi:hypothetical protein